MKLFKRSEKKKEEVQVQKMATMTELEQLCGKDKEAYEALCHAMFLDPRKIDTSLKDAIAKARSYEKEKDLGRAKIWFDIAGGLAIYEGDKEKVIELFGEAERISGMKYPILKNTDKAVGIALEYYKKHLSK